MSKAQKYIAITPALPARLPTDTARDIRDGDLADALMKYACQPPTVIGAVDPRALLQLDAQMRKPAGEHGIVTHIWHTTPVDGSVPVYLLPAWMAPVAPAFKMTLDDMYARDKHAASYRTSIMLRRTKAGTIAPYTRPHVDIGSDEIGKLSQFAQQYLLFAKEDDESFHDEGTHFYPVELDRDEAITMAECIALPHDDYEDDPQYLAMAEFMEKKLGDNAKAVTAMPGNVVRANPLLAHKAPAGAVMSNRFLMRTDYYAGPTDAEFQQLEDGTHPITKDMPPLRRMGYLGLMKDMHRPEHHLDRLQARHRRNWGVFAPLTMEWSQRYGKMAAIPSVIQRHHLVRHLS